MAVDERRALWLEVATVAGIVLLAAVLRMSWPGLTEFKADEARLYVMALEMSQGQFALRGISSSVGFPNFPMSVWLYSVPLFIWPHPYSATLFTGLLNTVSLAGAYWLARRYWGRTAALAALLMLAVSPWAIIYSRKIWAQNLLPLFTMVWGISAALTFVEGRRNWLIAHLVTLAVAVQIHLAAVALVPATLLFLVVFRRRVSWKAAAIGVGLALLTAAPFFAYLARSGTGLPSLAGAGEAGASLTLSADSLRYLTMVSVGSDLQSLAGPVEFEAYLDLLPPMSIVYVIWGGLILGGLVWLMGQAVRHRTDPRSQVGLILVTWLLAPLLVFALTWTDSFPHYFIAAFPAQYLIAGVAFQTILAAVGRWGKGLGWLVLLLTAAAQLFAWMTLLMFVTTRATPGGFGAPLSLKLAAAEAARTAVADGAAEVIIAGDGSSPRVDEFPAEYDALLHDVERRFVDVEREALFPAERAAVLLSASPDKDDTSLVQLYEESAVQSAVFPLRPGEDVLLVLGLPGDAAPPPASEIAPPNLLANWVRLVGVDWQPLDGSEGIWQLHWRPGENPDPATYHFFAHALIDGDRRIAQDDQPAFAGTQWRPGDQVISRFALEWTEGEGPPLQMRTGMYRYPEVESVPVLDEAANPAGEAIVVPLPSE